MYKFLRNWLATSGVAAALLIGKIVYHEINLHLLLQDEIALCLLFAASVSIGFCISILINRETSRQ